MKTEQALLDTLEKLLEQKSFPELTVSELAREAGLTTGAIYRRFRDKEDVLRAAFQRFQERTRIHDLEYPESMPDHELLVRYFSELMQFTLRNIHLMRAANSLNDPQSFNLMTRARDVSAAWLAGRLRSSRLGADELQTKCRFVLRIATATFRDTFLSGRGAVSDSQHYLEIHQTELDHLRDDLTEMAFGYLQLEEHRQVDAG